MPRTLAVDDPTALADVAAVLARGGTVIVPTETVYGVAASVAVTGATDRLFVLKGRPESVPLAVLVDGIAQAEELALLDGRARWLARCHWPGPLTLVVPRRPEAASLSLGGSTANVGVRCPDDAFVRSVAGRAGPIATTSANRHGRPTPATATDAAAALAGEVDLIIDGGRREGLPSTVVDCTGSELEVLRVGPVTIEWPPPSRVFDRIADCYDETRGGIERGRRYAVALASRVTGRRVLEIGVGTAAVAAGLAEQAIPVVGVDLSLEMLRRAVERLGPCVAHADATALPIGTGRVDTVIAVWVLHLVGDSDTAMAEAARVLRPGGRLLVIEAGPADQPDDDIALAVGDLHNRLRPVSMITERIPERAAANGFTLVEHGHTPVGEYTETPIAQARNLEQRVYSSLWDLPEGVWARDVEPVIAALRALPEPDRPRLRAVRHQLFVFERVEAPS